MQSSKFLQVVATALITSLLGYLINQLPAIQEFPHKDWWIVAAVVLLTLLAIAIALWQGQQGSSGDSSNTEETLRRIRPKLIQRLKDDVKLRLVNTLHELTKLDLRMEDQQQSVGKPYKQLAPEDPPAMTPETLLNREFQSFESVSSPVSLEPTRRMIEVFEQIDVQGKLLILGEPGAGKTTELLTLAQDLLERADNSDANAVPVIFELSEWKEDQPLDQWLVAQLQEVYKVPVVIGTHLLADRLLLPLLDGLDELGLVRQQWCIESINQFLGNVACPQLVVCCRSEEYEQGQGKLEGLNGAVYLRSLTDDQIKHYFQKMNDPAASGRGIKQPFFIKPLRPKGRGIYPLRD